MRAYLELHEVRERSEALRAALDDLLSRPRVAARPSARQWQFLRQCLGRLLDGAAPSESSADLERVRALQYRFEVQSRLRRFYLEPGRPISYVFELANRKRALRDGLIDDDYPSVSGYVLLVSPARPEIEPYGKTREAAEYLIRLVQDAAQAELAVYRALPKVELSPLSALFVKDGPAYLRVRNLAEEHARKGRTISVPEFNPSTMRAMAARLIERTDTSATVRTQEYWYLRWWSVTNARYEYVYQETNFQRYLLVCRDGQWLVDSNVYPQPRATTPNRRRR